MTILEEMVKDQRIFLQYNQSVGYAGVALILANL